MPSGRTGAATETERPTETRTGASTEHPRQPKHELDIGLKTANTGSRVAQKTRESPGCLLTLMGIGAMCDDEKVRQALKKVGVSMPQPWKDIF
jgi:hypothetical protein